MKAFTLALESMGKPKLTIGKIAPTLKLVNQYFNDSTGEGDHGEVDARGPWNEGDDWEFVESPVIAGANGAAKGGSAIHAESSGLDEGSPIRELLIEQLRDLLHAEKQLLKALPRLARAARSHQLRNLLQTHLEETEVQADRLIESLRLLGGNHSLRVYKRKYPRGVERLRACPLGR